MLNFHEKCVKTKKNARFVDKTQNKIYFIEIKTIQNVFVHKNNHSSKLPRKEKKKFDTKSEPCR